MEKWKPMHLVKESQHCIQEIGITITGPYAYRFKFLMVQMIFMIDWLDKNIPNQITMELLTPMASIAAMETKEAKQIIGETFYHNIYTIRKKQHCNKHDIDYLIITSQKLILRIKSLIDLITSHGEMRSIFEKIAGKISVYQINWTAEIGKLKEWKILFPKTIEETQKLEIIRAINTRNKEIRRSSATENLAAKETKKYFGDIQNIITTQKQEDDDDDKLNWTYSSKQYMMEIIEANLIDCPEKLRRGDIQEKGINKGHNSTDIVAREIGKQEEQQSIPNLDEMLLVDPLTGEPITLK